jgi:hypothetical protein
MHAFDYVMMLMSFVYALAITHVLATVGDIIGAWPRVRFSWLNATWMLFALLGVLTWWIGMWGLRDSHVWGMGTVTIFFLLAAILYLEIRLVCARIPHEGPVDLVDFHNREGRKYMTGFAVLTGFTVVVNVFYFGESGFADLATNRVIRVVLIQCLASIVAARFADRRVQFGMALIIGSMWAWYFTMLQGALT